MNSITDNQIHREIFIAASKTAEELHTLDFLEGLNEKLANDLKIVKLVKILNSTHKDHFFISLRIGRKNYFNVAKSYMSDTEKFLFSKCMELNGGWICKVGEITEGEFYIVNKFYEEDDGVDIETNIEFKNLPLQIYDEEFTLDLSFLDGYCILIYKL